MEHICIHCGTKMIEECKAEIWGGFDWVGSVSKKRVSSSCRCSVCPECGYMEFYAQKPEVFRYYLKKE